MSFAARNAHQGRKVNRSVRRYDGARAVACQVVGVPYGRVMVGNEETLQATSSFSWEMASNPASRTAFTDNQNAPVCSPDTAAAASSSRSRHLAADIIEQAETLTSQDLAAASCACVN